VFDMSALWLSGITPPAFHSDRARVDRDHQPRCSGGGRPRANQRMIRKVESRSELKSGAKGHLAFGLPVAGLALMRIWLPVDLLDVEGACLPDESLSLLWP